MLYTIYMWLLIAAATLFYGLTLAVLIPVARKEPLYGLIVRGWGNTIVGGSRVPVRITGPEKLDRGASYVFMSNHQSYFDVISLAAYLPWPFRFVAKRELVFVPVFGQVMWASGHIIINRSRHAEAVAELQKAADKIRQGTSILVFPEGTRSRDHRLGEFKKGGFMLALAAKAPVVPISITGTQPLMPKDHYTFSKTRVTVTIGDPILTAPLEPGDRDRLIAEVRRAIIQSFPPDSAEYQANAADAVLAG